MGTIKLNSSVKLALNEGLAHRLLHSQTDNPMTLEKLAQSISESRLDSSLSNNYSVLEAYSTIYSRSSSSIKQIIHDVDRIRNFYLVQVMISQIIEDAFTPELGTGNIFTIKYDKDPKIEQELVKLEKRLNLDNLVLDICPDLLCYGSYTLKTDIHTGEEIVDELGVEKKKTRTTPKGLVGLRDNVEQGNVIRLFQDTENMGYLDVDEKHGRLRKMDNASYVQFVFGFNRVRVKLNDQIPFYSNNKKLLKFLDTLPRYVKVGTSVIHPFISKIKELELMEKLIPATKLSKLSNVNLVGMTLPGQFDIEKGREAALRYENLINNKVGVDNKLGEITVESILSVAGRTKIIPLFGDKGALQKLDYKIDEADDLTNSVSEIRKIITDSIGVPYEIIYGSDGGNKTEMLKKNRRYQKKLKMLQKCVSDGIKEICCIHLSNKDILFDEDEITVEFSNKIVELDNLDALEHSDITISFIKNTVDFFQGMLEEGQPLRHLVNVNALAEYVNKQLETIGLDSVIRTSSEGGKNIEDKKSDVLKVPPTKKVDINHNKQRSASDVTGGSDDSGMGEPSPEE
jgi:hypothetical protein